MINIFKGIFSSKKRKGESETNFREQVISALNKCKNEKKNENENISNVKQWAKDIIVEIFDVPTAFWYEEMNEYENIKFHSNNLSVSKSLVEKTDRIISEYREQIKLSISKIDFCETLIDEYNKILDRYDNTLKTINVFKVKKVKTCYWINIKKELQR